MTTSTINTALPATGSGLNSAPVRNNFAAAASDINNIYALVGTPGTAAAKAASDSTKANLASVSGTPTVGHLAIFADTAGTIVDGGSIPSGGGITALTGDVTASGTGSVAATVTKINGQTPGTAALKAASDNTKTNVASVSGTPTAGHLAVFADSAGTVIDGGAVPSGGTVSSVFARTGAVTAQSGDYAITQITGATALAGTGSANILGTYGFYDYLNGTPLNTADATAQLQGFLLACQLKAYALNANITVLDDQMQRNFLIAELPRGNYQVTCPLIIPELVATRFQGTIIRVGQSGTPTNFYNGDVTTKALANLQQPTMAVVPNAHVLDDLDIYCNSNGSDRGSGIVIGKNWVADPSVPPVAVIPGTGYTVGDHITFPQVSKAPYYPIVVVVTSVNGGGGITGVTFTGGSTGSYALPPILQQAQWTAANGFTGSIANHNIGKVFDPANAGYYVTSGGTGTGAEFTVAWYADFQGSSRIYYPGAALGADYLIENMTVQALGSSTSTAYGPMFGTLWNGLNFDIPGKIQTNGGYYGTYFAGAADVHAGIINSVNAANVGIKCAVGGSLTMTAIVDSPMNIGIAIDGTSQVNIRHGSYGIQTNQPGITGAAFIVIGGDTSISSTSNLANAVSIDMTLQNTGSAGTTPALYLDYVAGAIEIDLTVSNTTYSGNAVPYPNNLFVQFGNHVSQGVQLSGRIDRVPGTLFSGTIPNIALDVNDAYAGGKAGRLGIYALYGSGPPTNGGSGTGVNKAILGSTYYDDLNNVSYTQTGAASSPAWAIPNYNKGTLGIVLNGGGSAIAAGIAGDVVAPYSGTITGVELLADQAGSIVVDVWKAGYASYPPTISNSICGSDLPTLASAIKGQDTALTGWTKSFSAGDVLRFNVNSASAVTRVTLTLLVTKS